MLFDYEVDSDDDWEEEEPGESLSDCEKKDDDDDEVDTILKIPKNSTPIYQLLLQMVKIVTILQVEEEDDDDNDGFFVPHGHLSEGEGCEDDEEEVHKHLLKPVTFNPKV